MYKIIKLLAAVSLLVVVSSPTLMAMEKDEAKIEQQEPSRFGAKLDAFIHDILKEEEPLNRTLVQILRRVEKNLMLIKSLNPEQFKFEEEIIFSELTKIYDDFFYNNVTKAHLLLLINLQLLNKSSSYMFNVYGLTEKTRECFQISMIRLMHFNDSDTIDQFYKHLIENNIEHFYFEVIKLKQQKNDNIFTRFDKCLATNLDDLVNFVLDNYDEIINENVLSQRSSTYPHMSRLSHLALQIMSRNPNISHVKFLRKLINEPRIKLKNWIQTQKLINCTKEIASGPEFKKREYLEAFNGIKLFFDLFNKAINWKKEKIEALRAKLFQAVDLENIERTKEYASALYAISISFENQNGDTPLHIAVLKNNVELIKALLSIFPDQIFVVNSDGKTPLHIAAAAGRETLKLMMDLAQPIKDNK